MSFLKTTLGKVAAGTFVAGAVAVGGVGIAHAADTADTVTPVSEVTPVATETAPAPVVESPAPEVTDPAPAPVEETPAPGDIALPPAPEGPAPVEETPAPLPPIERPTGVANIPGKSAEHRAATPTQAVENNQSHKIHSDKSEHASKGQEKKAEKSNR